MKLGIAQVDESYVGDCETHTEPLPLQPEVGDRFHLGTALDIALVGEDGELGLPVTFQPADGVGTIEVVLDGLDLVIRPRPGEGSFVLCP